MDAAGEDREELPLAFPLWLIGAAVLLVALARRRPLLAPAGAAGIAYDRRSLVDDALGTIGALTRPRHDEATA